MDRDLLGHLPIIACVARHRSFAAAAAELGMSPSAISHAVRSVEDRLAIPLFARTTRSVSLTEAGARFVAGVEPALTDIEKTVEGLSAERGEVTGLLRIDAARVNFEIALTRILAKLAQQHPRLTVEVRTGHTSVDIVAQGFDAGIRVLRSIHQDMVTTRLTGSFKVILVASRDYLDARGTNGRFDTRSTPSGVLQQCNTRYCDGEEPCHPLRSTATVQHRIRHPIRLALAAASPFRDRITKDDPGLYGVSCTR